MVRKSEPASPDPVDVQIGKRIRELRTWHRLSRGALGSVIGVSFEQVRKYETARNRVSARVLYDLACHFRVHFAYFIEGLPDPERHVRLVERPTAPQTED